jgi:ribosomal protein S18 acetylase RimI-like enzyme
MSENLISKFYKNGNTRYTIKRGSVIIGSILFMDDQTPSIYIAKLNVKPQFQNQSYGSKLLNEVITLARKNQCEAISLYVSTQNEAAIRFYRSLKY